MKLIEYKLIEYKHNDGQIEWFWINHKEVTVSPRFATKARAEEWYNLHDNWLERPAIIPVSYTHLTLPTILRV